MAKMTFLCKHCNSEFVRRAFPSEFKYRTYEFCSPACRNKARAIPDKTCPICNSQFKPVVYEGKRKKHCSKECAWKAQIGKRSYKRTPDEIRNVIVEMYPKYGAQFLADKFNMPIGTVQGIAYSNGIKLDPEVRQKSYTQIGIRMKENNPMKRPEVVEKVQEYHRQHPEMHERVIAKLFEGHARLQKSKPTKLEIKLFDILKELNIEFEPYFLIKTKFIVDVKIGNLIIQADGEYWHGHPRFEPLTDRQQKQRKRDKAQDKYLSKCGYAVARIWERELTKEMVIAILKQHNVLR